jgi:hypothetical protein
LHLDVKGKAEAVIALSPKLQVSPSHAFIFEMQEQFGSGCVDPVYKACRV